VSLTKRNNTKHTVSSCYCTTQQEIYSGCISNILLSETAASAEQQFHQWCGSDRISFLQFEFALRRFSKYAHPHLTQTLLSCSTQKLHSLSFIFTPALPHAICLHKENTYLSMSYILFTIACAANALENCVCCNFKANWSV